MGSRRGRNAALAALVVAGCSSGAPTGFSGGDRWSVPLVGALEDTTLIVPAYVGGKGPYLFILDPDENVSSVDEEVVKVGGLRTGPGPHLLDESDTEHTFFYAEVLEWRLGNLVVHNKPAIAVKDGTYDREGRRIHGVIGRDIIADSLVFGFDRDQGVMTLATQKSFHPEGDAFKTERVYSKIQNVDVVPPALRLVKATIGGKAFTMHVALGRVASELRPRSFGAAGLQGDAPKATVTFGKVTTNEVPIVAYRDKRWDEQDVEGNLGLSAFRGVSVFANWDNDAFYTRARTEVAPEVRIGRWPSLAPCAKAGCAKVSMIDPMAGKELTGPHPGLVVSVARDASTLQEPLEVLIAVTGKPNLPWLVASFPPGVERAMTHVPADWIGAQVAVVDASPFPRACPAEGACVDKIAH
ncbi:MAG: hypothetical protein JO257_12565 [Deltaproteobacteria bacterium]|nr:hypothetical protein [Deltaproteobacteria bacterium]